jgi:DnaJ-class molecular chaperone
MNNTNAKPNICPTCYGEGFDPSMQRVRPGAKLYPVPCQACGGTGRKRKTKPVRLLSRMKDVRRTRRGI